VRERAAVAEVGEAKMSSSGVTGSCTSNCAGTWSDVVQKKKK
jgi:hypothetical protein